MHTSNDTNFIRAGLTFAFMTWDFGHESDDIPPQILSIMEVIAGWLPLISVFVVLWLFLPDSKALGKRKGDEQGQDKGDA